MTLRYRPPLSDFNVLTSDDPDEALLSIRARNSCSEALTPSRTGDWKITTNLYKANDVTLIAMATAGHTIDGQPDQHIWIGLPLQGDVSLERCGRRFGELGRSEGFFFGHEKRNVTFHPSSCLMLVRTPADRVGEYLCLLERELDPLLIADSLAGLTNVCTGARL